MENALQEKLIDSIGNIEQAITNVAPQAFELAVRATFISGLSSFVSAVAVAGMLFFGYVASSKMRSVPPEDKFDKEFKYIILSIAMIVCAIVGTIFIGISIANDMPRIIDPTAITVRDMINKAL